MSFIPFQMFGGALLVAFLVIAVETLNGRIRPHARGMVSIWIGSGFLALGIALALLGPHRMLYSLPVVKSARGRAFVRDSLGFSGGTLFLFYGVLWRLSSRTGRRQLQHVTAAMARKTEQLDSSQAVLAAIVRSSVSGVLVLHAIRDKAGAITDFKCEFLNEEAEQVLGKGASVLRGEPILMHLPCLKEQGLFFDAIAVIEHGRPFRDERLHKDDDREMWYQLAIVKQGDGVIATFTDVTARKQTENKLLHASKHDLVTGLPARPLLNDRLAEAITRVSRQPNYKFAVLLMDVDRFKIVNDSLGHDIGDQLLISVSERIRENLRSLDTTSRLGKEHLQARLGGDEFVVLLDGIQDARDAIVVAERLQQALAAPHHLGEHQVTSTVSIGIVISDGTDGTYETPEEILRDADNAMHQAKESGKARHVIFDTGMHNVVMERLHLEKDLRQAAEKMEFILFYQPIVRLEDMSLRGFEALIRWPHPERGLVPPGQFIELAEEIGLIVPIGEWALKQASGQLLKWQAQRGPDAPLYMAVNLSKLQLTSPELLPSLETLMRNAKLPRKSLVLEVTESMIMDNAKHLFPVLASIREMGIRLAMDDFGTGHSSLSFLHQVPMDTLKIDRSFINRTDDGRQYGSIIRTIVQLAHDLEMDVVAEGIETPEQLALLSSLHCNYGQGYYFAKPAPAEEAEKFLDNDFRFEVAA